MPFSNTNFQRHFSNAVFPMPFFDTIFQCRFPKSFKTLKHYQQGKMIIL
jgi:hypothetical protein